MFKQKKIKEISLLEKGFSLSIQNKNRYSIERDSIKLNSLTPVFCGRGRLVKQ